MDINFGKSISDALGLGKQHIETTGDLSPRDAALAAKKEGHRGTPTTFPTGYFRTQRRIRTRARNADLARQSRQSMRIARQREDALNTAGQLARIHFGVVPSSLTHRLSIQARVHAQAENIRDHEGIGYGKALEKVETAMRESMQALDALRANKALADQKRASERSRAYADRLTEKALRNGRRTSVYRAPLGTPMPR